MLIVEFDLERNGFYILQESTLTFYVFSCYTNNVDRKAKFLRIQSLAFQNFRLGRNDWLTQYVTILTQRDRQDQARFTSLLLFYTAGLLTINYQIYRLDIATISYK